MNPERTDYSLFEAALKKAGINPAVCKYDVQEAFDEGVPNGGLAFAYFYELVDLIINGQMPVSYGTDKATDEETILWHADEIYISHQDFMNWISLNPINSSHFSNYGTLSIYNQSIQQSLQLTINYQREARSTGKKQNRQSNDNDQLAGKSRTTYRHLVAGLSELIRQLESRQRKPQSYPHDKIIKSSGELNTKGLAQLLTEIHPATPKSADRLISDALNDW